MSLSTRIAVATLVSLAVVTGAVTVYLVATPDPDVATATETVIPATRTPTIATPLPPTPELTAFADVLQGPLATSFDFAYPERTLSDLLPNRLFRVQGDPSPVPLAQAVVVGTVEGARLLPSGDLVVDVTVTSVIGGDAHEGPLSLSVPAVVAPILPSLQSMTPSDVFVIALDRPQSTSGLPMVRQSGSLWIDARGGVLTVLSMGGTRGEEFLGGITTLDELRAAASAPSTIRRIVDGRIAS